MWFWYAIVGVFGFEAIIQNINLSFQEKGFLTINDWINKAKYSAVARIIEKNVEAENLEIQLLTNKLLKLDEPTINTHIVDYLGEERLAQLEEIIDRNQNLNSKLIKAKALAQDENVKAFSINRTLNK